MKKVLLSTCATVALSAWAASAQDSSLNLRFAHWVPATHPMQVHGMTEWAESIAEASGGSISVTFFPAQQLGAAGDHYDMARDGIADITFVNPGYQPGRFPIIAAGELPFMFTDARAGSAALDAWYREHATAEMGDVHFCLVHLHQPGTFHSREAIRTPEDVRDLRVRPAHATIAAFISRLGGSNFQVPAPEARDALERGIADAITFPWNSLMTWGIDAAITHSLDMPLYATTFAWVMNAGTYSRMSETQQQVIDEHCNSEWAERVASGWAEEEVEGRQTLIDRDTHNVYEPTDEDIAAWREAAEPMDDAWVAGVSAVHADLDPESMLEALRADLAERGVGY